MKEKDQNRIPFIITYNKILPNVKQIIDKHQYLLQINLNLRTAFEEECNIAYQINKNLGDLIESKKILNGKVVRKNNNRSNNIVDLALLEEMTFAVNKFCKQTPSTFISQRTGKTLKNFHKLNCKSSCLVYFLKCRIYQLQCVNYNR